MFLSILTFLTLFVLLCQGTRGTERHYECGPHGRFEYCIDGIPGCVVGCHCHPGYFFDTDSKICEPNGKLQHEFRRHYMSEVFHMHTPVNTPKPTLPTPTPTPKTDARLDEKVEEIAKDTDDIGDWLYNQFFKTIENQVINKTNNDKPRKLTRRSGSGPPSRKTKRKSHKTWKDSKKKKGKVHGLRRKLLRITEDDSLFDSGSSSETSDDSSSTSSESDSGDTTSESKGKKDDKEHGHSTLLLFNKKQQPPLPSFIFLPHMGTPFYPPIGLPPPPVLPMYPMAPIPPMAPICPDAGSNNHIDEHKNNATSDSTVVTSTESSGKHTNAPHTDTTVPNSEPSNDNIPEDTVPKDTNNDDTITPDANDVPDAADVPDQSGSLRTRFNIRHGKKSRKGNTHPKEPGHQNMFRSNPNKGSRNKLMQRLRENMKNKMPHINQYNDEQEEDSPLMNDFTSQEAYSANKKMHLRAMGDGISKMKDVDFKYLSELIHRANVNDPNKVPAHPIAPTDNIRRKENFGPVGRRSYQNEPVQQYTQQLNSFIEPRNLQTSGTDNAFYSNLGRQIATMIRNIDSKGEREVNIEIERANPTISQTILNQNRYAPRSYWERSVRSPLHYFKEELEYLNPSNEKLLYSLEKEVENAANTSPSLSLRELEDILSTMSNAKTQIQRKVMFEERKPNTYINNTRLNINLLPNHVMRENHNNMLHEASKNNGHKANTTHPKGKEVNITKSSDTRNKSKMSKYPELGVPADFWWLDMIKPVSIRETEINKSISHLNPFYDLKPTRRTITDDMVTTIETIQTLPRRHHVDYLKFVKSVAHRQLLQATTTMLPSVKYHTQVLNYLSYFPGSKNDYRLDQKPNSYPQQISSFSSPVNTPFQRSNKRPSYFHHELHHFDYFE